MRLGLYSRRVSWLNRLRPIRPSSAGTRFMWSRPVDEDAVRRAGYPRAPRIAWIANDPELLVCGNDMGSRGSFIGHVLMLIRC